MATPQSLTRTAYRLLKARMNAELEEARWLGADELVAEVIRGGGHTNGQASAAACTRDLRKPLRGGFDIRRDLRGGIEYYKLMPESVTPDREHVLLHGGRTSRPAPGSPLGRARRAGALLRAAAVGGERPENHRRLAASALLHELVASRVLTTRDVRVFVRTLPDDPDEW